MDAAGIEASSGDGSSSRPLSLVSPPPERRMWQEKGDFSSHLSRIPTSFDKERAIKQNILLERCDVTEIKGGCDTWRVVSDQCAVVFCVFIEMSQTYTSYLIQSTSFFPSSAQLPSSSGGEG